MKANSEIRETAKKFSVCLWEVADAWGKSEPTLHRWLRHELSDEQKADFIKIIEKIAATRAAKA